MAHWDGIAVGNNADQRQEILNQFWPLVDEAGKRHARGIPNRDSIVVLVRVVFARDGETRLEGQALRWHEGHVYVEIGDPRMQVRGVWLDARDVRRMAGPLTPH